MRVLIGTSGYQYKAWRGSLYPERCKDADMLSEYSRVLATVEVNNTFYRMPKPGVFAKWAEQVPDGFRFAIKAPRWLTPISKIATEQAPFDQLGAELAQLGPKLGPVLFQSPPNVLKNCERLREFLARLPKQWQASFDLRHPSWQDPEVLALLRAHGAALCLTDSDEPERPWVATADFGYVRLRRGKYSDKALRDALQRIRAERWQTVYVFLKHEDEAPALVRRVLKLAGPAPLASAPEAGHEPPHDEGTEGGSRSGDGRERLRRRAAARQPAR
jgi:uncharacterized protein YecE (DUF72 family)